MQRTAFVIALIVAGCFAVRPKWNQLEGYSFERYIQDFQKPHVKGTAEYALRERIFTAKLNEVRAFNVGGATYKKGINRMSDWTAEEIKAIRGRVPDSQVKQPAPVRVYEAPADAQLPLSKDWRQTFPPVLTAVKDQGMCGSCWAHASTESIESHWAINTGDLFVLSQQQMTSCVNNSQQCGGTGGCFGATAELGWDYVKQAGGITEEWMYSYTSYFGESGVCTFNATATPAYAQVYGHVIAPRNNDSATAAAVALVGPQAISVDASSWSDYESGVYTGCNYNNNISMDHAVQLIGYGHDDSLNLDYWLVRNSWSASWGENGYIRLIRTDECGWNVDWIVNGGGCVGGNNTIWACGQCGILYDVAYPLVTPQ